jgi:hypothetical protein
LLARREGIVFVLLFKCCVKRRKVVGGRGKRVTMLEGW